MALAKAASYLNHWKDVIERHQVILNQGLRDLLLRRYTTIIHMSFNRWRQGQAFKLRTQKL
jgi:hypothetical protein